MLCSRWAATSSSAVPYIEANPGFISSEQNDLCSWKVGSWKAGGQSAGDTGTHLQQTVFQHRPRASRVLQQILPDKRFSEMRKHLLSRKFKMFWSPAHHTWIYWVLAVDIKDPPLSWARLLRRRRRRLNGLLAGNEGEKEGDDHKRWCLWSHGAEAEAGIRESGANTPRRPGSRFRWRRWSYVGSGSHQLTALRISRGWPPNDWSPRLAGPTIPTTGKKM